MTQIETPQERAKRIRRENKAKREERRRAYWEQEQIDRACAVVALRKVRDDENSTPQQRLEAVQMISHICGYNHVPPVQEAGNTHKDLTAAFRAELEARQSKCTT